MRKGGLILFLTNVLAAIGVLALAVSLAGCETIPVDEVEVCDSDANPDCGDNVEVVVE